MKDRSYAKIVTAFNNHIKRCKFCHYDVFYPETMKLCNRGRILFDEYLKHMRKTKLFQSIIEDFENREKGL